MAFDTKYPVRDFRVMISYTLPGIDLTPVEKAGLVTLRSSLKRSLEEIGLFSSVMDDKAIISEVGNILNHQDKTEEHTSWYTEYDEISKQIPSASIGIEVKEDCVLMRDGAFAAQTFIPAKTPNTWALAHMDKLFGDILSGGDSIPCPFLCHYGFSVCEDQTKQKAKVTAKKGSLEKTLGGQAAKYHYGIEDEYREVCEIANQIQAGESIIDSCLSMTVLCRSEDVEDAGESVKAMWTPWGFEASVAKQNQLHLFLGSLPMTWTTRLSPTKKIGGAGKTLSNRGITRRTITKESQNLLPVVAEWTGQRAPGIPLVGRRGQLFFWNPFDGEFVPGDQMYKSGLNKNFCIAGAARSGKSFLCCEIIKETLAVGGKAFVLDKGRSFENLCKKIDGGRHIDLKADESFSLNPFTHIPTGEGKDESDARSDLLGGLKAIVKSMAFTEGQFDGGGFLGEAVDLVWEKYGQNGNIDKIHNLLKAQDDSRPRDIARCLLPFTTNGEYGHFFNPPADVDISSDFVVIETESLSGTILNVMTMVMITQVWQKMITSDKNAPFLVLIDEAWELLAGKESGAFINKLVRTASKYRCSLGVATQNLTDFQKVDLNGMPLDGAASAWKNSSWKLIFRQEQDDITGFKNHPQLRDFVKDGYREAMLRSLGEAVDFSEFLIYSAHVSCAPARLFVDPYHALLYSTTASEVSALKKLQAQGKTLTESIECILVSREKRRGA